MYLAAVIDWHSRFVLGWRLSNTLDGSFCLELLREVLASGKPEVFNTFTASAFTGALLSAGVAISMDGRGRCLDNIFVERLWRSVKYDAVFIRGYESVAQLRAGTLLPVLQRGAPAPVAVAHRTPAEMYRAVG